MTQGSFKHSLLIPVEISVREFDARLRFGAEAVRRGHQVAIGRSRDLHRRPDLFSPSIIVENDVTVASADFFRRARSMGHRIVAWDEEAIAVLSDQWYTRQRVARESLEQVDLFFTRGMGDAAAIEAEHPKLKDRVKPAGNPRLDLLSPLLANATPMVKSDAPIAVMSRFSRSNPFSFDRNKVLPQVTRKFRFGQEEVAFYAGYLEHTHTVFDAFFSMVGRLAERFPRRQIVVRPHPSERTATWESLAESYPNLSVQEAGSAVDLAAKSAVIIHNGCTTGMEAALLGRPVLAFVPVESSIYDVRLPNILSTLCSDEEQLFEAVATNLVRTSSDKVLARKAWAALEYEVGDGTGRLATEVIIEAINCIPPHVLRSTNKQRAVRLAAKFIAFGRFIRQKLSLEDASLVRARADYYNKKFPDTDSEAVTARLRRLGYSDVVAEPLYLGWWVLRSKRDALV